MAQQHTTPEKSLAAAYAAEQRAQAGRESRMRNDACYAVYAEALQCLDDNDYSQEACAAAFQAFNDCRAAQEAASAAARLKAQEADPLIGWAVRRYNAWRDQGTQEAAAAAEAAAAEAAAAAKAAAEAEQQRQQQSDASSRAGWRPPEGEPRRDWKWKPPPPPKPAGGGGGAGPAAL